MSVNPSKSGHTVSRRSWATGSCHSHLAWRCWPRGRGPAASCTHCCCHPASSRSCEVRVVVVWMHQRQCPEATAAHIGEGCCWGAWKVQGAPVPSLTAWLFLAVCKL
eukprot:scaffold7831_cov108-Isochrysis_galbana.AAC.13